MTALLIERLAPKAPAKPRNPDAVRVGVPGMAAFRELRHESARTGMPAWADAPLDRALRYCMSEPVRRFGIVLTPTSLLCLSPAERYRSAAEWQRFAGDTLEATLRDHAARFWLWTTDDGVTPAGAGIDLYDALRLRPEERFAGGDLVRVVDPWGEGNCTRACNRLGQVLRVARPLVIVDVEGVGAIGMDPAFLRRCSTRAAAARRPDAA